MFSFSLIHHFFNCYLQLDKQATESKKDSFLNLKKINIDFRKLKFYFFNSQFCNLGSTKSVLYSTKII